MNIDHEFLEELRNWVYAPRCYTPNLERFKNIELFSLPDGQIHFGARFADVYTVSLLQGE